jgi:hypothetical protein
MFLGLCLFTATLVCCSLAAGPGRRPAARRSRELRRHPERVALADVAGLLADSQPGEVVARVLDRAAGRRLTALTMWRWAAAHGTDRLVTVVDAGVAEDTLLDHLDAGTAPDWTALAVFAGLANDTLPAGIPIDELVDLDIVPDYDDLTFLEDLSDWSTASPDPIELRRFDDLPPIAGPGLAPFRPIAEWESEGDWPEVA